MLLVNFVRSGFGNFKQGFLHCRQGRNGLPRFSTIVATSDGAGSRMNQLLSHKRRLAQHKVTCITNHLLDYLFHTLVVVILCSTCSICPCYCLVTWSALSMMLKMSMMMMIHSMMILFTVYSQHPRTCTDSLLLDSIDSFDHCERKMENAPQPPKLVALANPATINLWTRRPSWLDLEQRTTNTRTTQYKQPAVFVGIVLNDSSKINHVKKE
jgi:hypothetical protein